jgi:hypothetical protein
MEILFKISTGFLLLAVALSACSGPSPVKTLQAGTPAAVSTSYPGPVATNSPNNPGQAAAYPQPQATLDIASYPAPTTASFSNALPSVDPAYPAPPPSPTINPGTPVKVVPFKINKPLSAGMTEITGSGPADIPITLADITSYGDIVGEGTISSDGTFTIKLNKPLEVNQWIGITYSNLKNTKWVPSNFDDPGFRGDSPQLIPLVGYFFDTAEVAEK